MKEDLDSVQKNLEFAQKALGQIIRGERPFIDRPNHWFVHQLDMMYSEGYLMMPSASYVNTPGLKKHRCVTGLHPLPHLLRTTRLEILDLLKQEGVYDAVDVQGSQVLERKHEGYKYHPPEHKKGFITPKADVFAAYEMADVLLRKMKAKKGDTILQKPLGINNRLGRKLDFPYWEPLLKGTGVTEKVEFFKSLNVHIEDNNFKASQAVVKNLSKSLNVPSPPPCTSMLKPGDTIFVHTSTLEKLIELRMVFKEKGIVVRSINELEVIAHNPPEKSASYEGNALEKLEAAYKAMSQVSDELLARKFGLTREQTFIMADDSGIHFNERRLLEHFDLNGMEHIVSRERYREEKIPFPGVELASMMNASNGVGNLCYRASTAFSKINKPDLSLENVTSLAFTKSPPHCQIENLPGLERQQIFMTYGQRTQTFQLTPKPEIDSRLLETRHFFRPEGKSQTQSEIEVLDPITRFTETQRADAAKAMLHELMNGGKFESNYQLYEGKFSVSTPNAGVESWLRTSLGRHFDVRQQPSRLKCPLDVDARIEGADAFVLLPPRQRNDQIKNVIEKHRDRFWFWSLIVARQTDPRDSDKPIVLYNPNGEWNSTIEEYLDLHAMGAIKERPDLLFDNIGSGGGNFKEKKELFNETVKCLEKGRDMRNPPTRNKNIGEEGTDPIPTNRFNVGIYLSASSENSQNIKDAHDLSYSCIASEMGVVYGAMGRYSGGEIAQGVEQAIQDGIDDFFFTGSSIDHLALREGKPHKLLTDVYNKETGRCMFLKAKNIYQRMLYMVRSSDAFAIQPGGAGTMQELEMLLWLKANGSEHMKGKEIAILNTPVYENGEKVCGYYDKVLQNITEQEREFLSIHVVDTVEEQFDKLEKIRLDQAQKGLEKNGKPIIMPEKKLALIRRSEMGEDFSLAEVKANSPHAASSTTVER